MKIAFFNDTYHPYVSGVITSMERFADSLKEYGHDVLLVVPGLLADSKRAREGGVFELLSIPVPGFDGMRIGTPIMTDGHLSISGTVDANVDLVHAHSPFIVGKMGARLAEKRDLPLVFTCHSIYPNYSDYVPLVSELAEDVIREYVIDFCSRCDLILAPSEYARSVLWDWGVSQEVEVLPSGIEAEDLERARREVAASEGEVRRRLARDAMVPPRSRILLFVGRLDHRKNIDFLFEVLGIIHKEERIHLVIVGEGPAHTNLEDEARRRRILDRVRFTGKLPFDRVARWYAAADVFCFPSTSETQGLVLVEAMAAGLPVVALKSPTSREIVDPGVNGLLSDEDPEEFASKVSSILRDPELASRLRRGGLERAKGFSNEALTRELIGHYERLIERIGV
ncbi:MAG: glycosyltransferase, partial [Bacillota bacterium]